MKVRRIHTCLLTRTCLLALSILAITAGSARATLLSDLVTGGGSIQVGKLLFNNFSYLSTGDMPSASAINVNPFIVGADDVGLNFQGAFLDFLGGDGSDAVIGYNVTVVTADTTITGSTLTGNPTVLGGSGVMSVTQTFQPTSFTDQHSIYSISPGPTVSLSHLALAGGYTSLSVQDSVLAFSAGGVPTLSFFNATFQTTSNPIPEPATAALLGIGIAIMGWRRLRRS